jgi:PLP dependent protein
MVNEAAYKNLLKELRSKQVALVAVSKTKTVQEIQQLYDLGQRNFGENYVQELVEKEKQLPKDIRWHFIGHLQRNKVKLIAPFIHLIHSVDSFKLLDEINNQGVKANRIINCLLQMHIAVEETKYGFSGEEIIQLMQTFQKDQQLSKYNNIKLSGLMGMASLTDDMNKVRTEFKKLKAIFDELTKQDAQVTTLSMGMTSDYKIAIEEGSNMLRIGSLIFGSRYQATTSSSKPLI